jgi:hypothetical protein
MNMQSLDMKGPFWLNHATVDATVGKRRPGNYALGELSADGSFIMCQIGSSGTDVNSALKTLVDRTPRRIFKFSYAESAQSAFEKECLIYHDHSPIDNTNHPHPTTDTFTCPVCIIKPSV